MSQNPLEETLRIPEVLPLLPLRDVVVFPFMILPLFVTREMSIGSIDAALSKDRLIMLTAQKDIVQEDPDPQDMYSIGTVAMIMRMLKLPDGRVKIMVQGLTKARILDFEQRTPIYQVHVEPIPEEDPPEMTLEIEALMRNVKEQLEQVINLGKMLSTDVMMVVETITEPGRLADLVASNMNIKVSEAQQMLEIDDPVERLSRVGELLSKELELLNVQAKIQSAARDEINKTQREYFLREQLKAIKEQLGDADSQDAEVEEMAELIAKAKMPAEVEKEALKQLERMDRMHPDSAEANIVRTYLDWMVALPWKKSARGKMDIQAAKRILDEDHYGLDKVKERILEFLSVHKLKRRMRGPILCFVGPPGVGKTSLGKSIARAMGRKFVRISLGGLRDEAEIRGHRRTYIGALPGRIIQGIKQTGNNNPVFMMDEVDKIGQDFRGDPSSALLEVLDPEQNHSFSDHYLNVPFDLSNVMFITTANLMDPIPSALKDRMEVIRLPGYTQEEKKRIAFRFLIPRQIEENGLNKKQLELSAKAVEAIINGYTREAGLRSLEREIASICRKAARRVAESGAEHVRVTASNLHRFLGPPSYLDEEEIDADTPGVATGLAWTPFGGEVLHVETQVVKGKGTLSLTGQLGDVMKESAQAALTYIRSRTEDFGIREDFYRTRDIHVHVPAGAIPKDGPSAGVTIAASLVSALTGRPVRTDVAMTGEISLTGRVLPVGGIKEKVLAAASRSGIREVIIPENNMKDLQEIPREIRAKLTIQIIHSIDDALEIVLPPSNKRGASLKESAIAQRRESTLQASP